MPPFDPVVSEARRDHGRLPERIRTWPGAHRSVHPEPNLVAADDKVFLLGAPLDALTLVYHAERIAAAEPKRWVEDRFGTNPS